ncbi:MAG: rod shape-determining protein MreC [Chloroflexi bacterium]|nr:rod shape-determining protein MreC [Chloroflexota bacterium]
MSSRNRNTILFFLIVIAVLALILHQAGILQPIEDLALGAVQPIFGGVLGVGEGARDVTTGLTDVNNLRNKVDELQAQLNELNASRIRITELENENTLLRQQLGYKQSNPDFDLAGAVVLQRNPDLARVTGQDPSNLARYIIVDQGSADGIKIGMPVVTPQGLAGRIVSTGSRWSKVLLITDAASSVSAVVQSTRATGIVQGNVNGNLVIKYVPQGEAIKTGDLILSSGMGGTYPKRLVIGQVTQVHKLDNELFQEAMIMPSVDFTRLEFVLILKKFTPADITQEPTPTPTPLPKATPTRTPAP